MAVRDALVVALHRDIAALVRGRPTFLAAKDAVSLDCAIAARMGPHLGVRSAILCLAMECNSAAFETRIDRKTCADLSDVLLLADGRKRYAALRLGGHLAAASMDAVAAWLGDRPYERWYALRDAGHAGLIDRRGLRDIPREFVSEVVLAPGADERLQMYTAPCEHDIAALLVPSDVVLLVSMYPRALVSSDWLAANLTEYYLNEALIGRARKALEEPGVTLPDAEWLAASPIAAYPHFLLNALRAHGCLPRCAPEWLFQVFCSGEDDGSTEFFTALVASDHVSRVSPDWLAARLPTILLTPALFVGHHVAALSFEYLAKHLSGQHWIVRLLHATGRVESLSREYIERHVPAEGRAGLLFYAGLLADLEDLTWIEANVQIDFRETVLLETRARDRATPEWIARWIAPDAVPETLQAMGFLDSCSRDWMMQHLRGKCLLQCMEKRGLSVLGGEPLQDLIDLYGDATPGALAGLISPVDLHGKVTRLVMMEILRRCNATNLSPDHIAWLLDYDELLILGTLRERDLLRGSSNEWLREHMTGTILALAFDAVDRFDDMSADELRELAETEIGAMSIVMRSGRVARMTADEMETVFGSEGDYLVRTLASTGRLGSCDPEMLWRRVPRDKLGAAVRRTTAYRTMEPELFQRYGLA